MKERADLLLAGIPQKLAMHAEARGEPPDPGGIWDPTLDR